MTRPADSAVARAFWEARLIQSSFQTGADFADWVIDAAAIDEADPGGADRESEGVMKVACPIPTCRAELLPGQTCGGVNCGLKTKVAPDV